LFRAGGPLNSGVRRMSYGLPVLNRVSAFLILISAIASGFASEMTTHTSLAKAVAFGSVITCAIGYVLYPIAVTISRRDAGLYGRAYSNLNGRSLIVSIATGMLFFGLALGLVVFNAWLLFHKHRA